jgi:hypothetical protein
MDEVVERFEDLDRITSIVGRPTPSLAIKHVVSLKRKSQQSSVHPYNKKDEKGYAFIYNFQNIAGMYFECKGSIVLEGYRVQADKQGANSYKKLTCYIDMKDAASFLNRVDIAYSWLAGEENKNIYLADSKGRPCKIVEQKRTVASLTESTYIAFKPCIIRDLSDMAYEGIAMGSEQGEISNFTASEFASFRVQMHSLLPNLYIANNTVINNALQYFIYNKLYSQ